MAVKAHFAKRESANWTVTAVSVYHAASALMENVDPSIILSNSFASKIPSFN